MPSIGRYLHGLTWGRAGLVLVICTFLALRQVATFYADGDPQTCTNCNFTPSDLLTAAKFVARQFLAALPMLFAVTIADNLTRRTTRVLRIFALAGAVLMGAFAFTLVFHLSEPELAGPALPTPPRLLAYFSRAALYGGLATAVLYLFARERGERQVLHEVTLAKLALDRQMIEARLQALQAQIEPHFLFNTLANIGLLYEVDPLQAKPLLQNLSSYLAATLPQMRETSSTVGRELAMAQAYLAILKVRMTDRLSVDIDVPDAIRNAALPPMMLLTLVENAIKHGLNPRPQGGMVRILAERNGSALRVAVIDDGVGFGKGKGSGVGLANIRARLAMLHGAAGRLLLDGNAEGGITAVIELPGTIADAGASMS